MAINSRDSLLSEMQGNASTWGWGAITVFNRERLNRLLEQQFIEGYQSARYFPALTKDFELPKVNRYVKLNKLILGAPLISFETASLDRSRATVTMNIVAGDYSEEKQLSGEPDVLISRVKIKETHGFKIVATVDLSITRGDIDRVGRVTLDLSAGLEFTSNLGGLSDINLKIGTLFHEHFSTLPAHKKIFQLGVLNLNGYNPLTPVNFDIRTQCAPGANIKGADNEGDGAVVVFIDLAGSSPGLSFPDEDSDFLYFIPDDQLDGQDQYSAALVINHAMVADANKDNMALLTTLLFPGQHHFEASSCYEPHDRIVFGNLSPSSTLYSVEPTFSTIKAAKTQRFTFQDAAGNVVNDVTWEARSLNSFGGESAGSMSGNIYTAAPRSTIGHDTLRVVITARYNKDGQVFQASALLLVAYEDISISPQISERQVDAQASDFLPGAAEPTMPKQWLNALPVKLTAAAGLGDEVEWSLLGAGLGSIQGSGATATYTLPSPSEMEGMGLVDQRIQAYNKTTEQVMTSSVLLSPWKQVIDIEPAFVDNLKPSAQVQLTTTWDKEGEVIWAVVSGDGSVDDNGLFTASASSEPQSNVVLYTYNAGPIALTGYSVIETTGYEPQKAWDTITMSVKVVGGQRPSDAENVGRAYGNGWQQIHLRASLLTTGGELSPEEKDTLTLVKAGSNQELVAVDQNNEYNIPYGTPIDWAFATQNNSFEFFGVSAAANPTEPAVDPLAETTKNLYVVTRPLQGQSQTETFFLRITDSYNFTHDSAIEGDEDIGKVHLTPEIIPTLTRESYSFEKNRVYTEEGGIQDPGTGEYSYDYNYVTIDYWTLFYPQASFRFMRFERIDSELTQSDINLSTIQWESDMLEETMFSYTGSAFIPEVQSEEVPEYLTFDPQLLTLDTELTADLTDKKIDVAHRPSRGQMLVSMHRTDDVKYIKRSELVRKHLDKGVNFEFQDVNGNFHGLTVSFEDASNPDSRNKLILTTFARDDNTGEGIKS